MGTWLSLHWDHLHEGIHPEGLGCGPMRCCSKSHGQQGPGPTALQPLFRGDTEGWILGDDGFRFCISKRMSSEVFVLDIFIFLYDPFNAFFFDLNCHCLEIYGVRGVLLW